MKFRMISLTAALLAAAPATVNALEGPQSFVSHYTISIIGVPLAKSSFVTTINGDNFAIKGVLRSVGVARVFDKTSAETSVSGVLTDNGAQSKNYMMRYVSGKSRSLASLLFANGNVVSSKVVPAQPARKGFVPIGPEHMKAVSDPLTSALVKAGDINDVCKRTLHVFDGKMRLDLALSNPQIEAVSVAGFKGNAVTCQARFVPIAGYRKGQKSIEFLRDSKDISITFAQNGSTGVYGPISASVQTYIGRLNIRATHFSVAQ